MNEVEVEPTGKELKHIMRKIVIDKNNEYQIVYENKVIDQIKSIIYCL